MFKLFRQFIFIFVFLAYSLLFYLLFYHGISLWKAELLDIPSQLSAEYVISILFLFSLIVILSYIGACYVVEGRLPSPPRSLSTKKPPKKRPPLQTDPIKKDPEIKADNLPNRENRGSSNLAPRKPLPLRGKALKKDQTAIGEK